MIRIKSPGRICLFGEHQDYLGYPTISMAISKFIYLKAKKSNLKRFSIQLSDFNRDLEIPLKNRQLAYESDRDYLLSGYNQFIRRGIKFQQGFDIEINGDIPINAGAASSSALVVAWLYFLNLISNRPLNKRELALEGFNTEVKEFKEAGGYMDFYNAVFGHVLFLNSQKRNLHKRLYRIQLPGFILGHSLQKKKTVEDLKRIKEDSLRAFEVVGEILPQFNKFTTKLIDIKEHLESIKERYRKKIIGNLINRDITIRAKQHLEKYLHYLKEQNQNHNQINQFYKKLGVLINKHQAQLQHNIGITTKKIDKMIRHCIDAGALGAKINGSGFGGTIFAFGIGQQKDITRAIQQSAGIPYKISTVAGVKTY
ncbi:MAG: hypothetical protein BAJALOKI3v1_220048 [Promethearchaeota archaeon]|nr:MAG: hypothetical protein BAJALOKI3v1_220048 [Candidatus Lokiarchaeota archaeon]